MMLVVDLEGFRATDQKALFTREAFIECGPAPPFSVDDVEVVGTYEESSSLPGVSDSAPAETRIQHFP